MSQRALIRKLASLAEFQSMCYGGKGKGVMTTPYRNATRYFWPSFSSSASTQSVTNGVPENQPTNHSKRVDYKPIDHQTSRPIGTISTTTTTHPPIYCSCQRRHQVRATTSTYIHDALFYASRDRGQVACADLMWGLHLA